MVVLCLILSPCFVLANSNIDDGHDQQPSSFSPGTEVAVTIVQDSHSDNVAQRFFQGANYHNLKLQQANQSLTPLEETSSAAGSR